MGHVRPRPACSATDPCTRLLFTYERRGAREISAPIETPQCRTGAAAAAKGRAAFDDGAPRSWLDPQGITRYHFEFRPEGAGSSSRRPLLLFFAGSGGSASNAYDNTSPGAKAAAHDLTGDPARPGFLLVCPQARNLHGPNDMPNRPCSQKPGFTYTELWAASTAPRAREETPPTLTDLYFYR